MKWELLTMLDGREYCFVNNGLHELRIYARDLDSAIKIAKSMLADGAEFDIEGWDE